MDILDELCHTYSAQRKTNRWPFAFFMNLINVAGVASFVLWRTVTGKIEDRVGMERKKHLTQISAELTHAHIKRRSMIGLSIAHQQSIRSVFGSESEEIESTSTNAPPAKRAKRRCYICPHRRARKIKQTCDDCHRNVCSEHARATFKCQECFHKPKLSKINVEDSE